MTRILCIFTCLKCGYRDTFPTVGSSPPRCPYGCERPDLLERHEYRFEADEDPADVEKRPKRRLPRVRVPLRAGETLDWRLGMLNRVLALHVPAFRQAMAEVDAMHARTIAVLRETSCCGDPGDCQCA